MACERVLFKIKSLIINSKDENHKTYLNVWKSLRYEDNKIAAMFDDLKRSNAVLKMATMVKHGIIDNRTLSAFSNETQDRIKRMNEF